MRAANLRSSLLALVLVAVGVAAGLRICGKSGPSRSELEVYPSLEDTLCEVIAKAPPARAQGPLPDDTALAAWTEQVEGALAEGLALVAMEDAHTYWHSAPTERDVACARKLWTAASRLPPEYRLRRLAEDSLERLLRKDAGSSERTKLAQVLALTVDASSSPGPSSAANAEAGGRFIPADSHEPECQDATKYLSAFPANARLRRALILHFRPCLYDNFSSEDGALDRAELFMRETVSSWPERVGLDFELLVAQDPSSQEPAGRTWMWLRVPFARITLDLGLTGNALWVVRDLAKRRPAIVKELLPVARAYAAKNKASNRKARWTALVAYLEAGAPDPGEPREPALARALDGDERSARWALGYLPNELEEHAPRPFPYLRDPEVITATVARAELVTTDEDRMLVLDALSQMPPGTALAMMARSTSSPNESVWRAAVAAMEGQIKQLPIKAEPGELEAGRERRRHAAKLLAPQLAVLRAGLAPRLCAHPEGITFLADADDKGIDAEVLRCIEGKAQPDTGFLTTLFHSCLDHPDLGWVQTGAALSKTAAPGENGQYARRVAEGCRTGKD